MARIHGRRGRLYVGVASDTAIAEPLPFVASWTLEADSDRDEVTALGDVNKVFVAGLPDASGTFAGFYDTATAQTYTAALDGLARKFYLYPDTSTTTSYFFGTGLFDFSTDGGVSGSVKMKGKWQAASSVTKVG